MEKKITGKYYVVKNERMKNYLYNLGFNFELQKDKITKVDYVYLFKNSNNLLEAITFYSDFRRERKHLS